VRKDRERPREILNRRRKRGFGDDPHPVSVELLDAPYPINILKGDRLVFRLRYIVKGIDNILRVELGAIMEFYASAQLDFERLFIDPFPSRRQLSRVAVGDGIAMNERIPDMMANDHADAYVVEIRSHVFRCLIVSEPDRIILLAGDRCGRPCERRKQRESQAAP
jgi:hypothetical protein